MDPDRIAPPVRSHGAVNVIIDDPDLAQHLTAPQRERARREGLARVIDVPTGAWSPPETTPEERGALGLLVLEGVLLRQAALGDRQGLEVFGPEDLVRATEPGDDVDSVVSAEVRWWALSPTRLADLDTHFTRRMCGYPQVIDELAGRIERRSSAHALRFVIVQQPRLTDRLHLLLWHLADRFGRVLAGGVVLPLALSHGLLAQLVGARRPSVSRALKELERAEIVKRRPDGSWWLAGEPPNGVQD